MSDFGSPYKFKKDDVVVVLQHHLEKNIRVSPDDEGELDHEGGFGKKAQWKVNITKEDGELRATFCNEKSGDYLRIFKDGEKINAKGKGKGLCVFKVHRISSGVVKLESVETPGAYVAVSKDGLMVGKGGKRCRIETWKEGPAETFSKPYLFKKENTVVIEHRDDANLRISPNDDGQVNSKGGKGDLAQWIVIPNDDGDVVQIKSKKTDGYLRITKNDQVDAQGDGGPWTFFKVHQIDAKNEVRLESQKAEGKFLEYAPDGNSFAAGGNDNRKSIFHFFRE